MKKAAVILIIFILSFTSAAQAYDDITGTLTAEDKAQLRTFLAACADITSYDSKSYDYDTLFKYILYTHENFRVITDIDPLPSYSGGVNIVSGEFIDYVMNSVFHIEPERPSLSALTERGFCYNNGYYLYTGGFNVFFSTDITEIDGVYDLGGDTLLVTFSDVYTEGYKTNPEKSYAIVRRENYGYSLLRLGMGKNTPDFAEAASYNPVTLSAASPQPSQQGGVSSILLPLLLLICALGVCCTAVSIILIIRSKK